MKIKCYEFSYRAISGRSVFGGISNVWRIDTSITTRRLPTFRILIREATHSVGLVILLISSERPSVALTG